MSAFLDLNGRAKGMIGAAGRSSTVILGRFLKSKPHPAKGLSGSGLAGRGEWILQIFKRSKSNFHLMRCGITSTYCTGEGAKGTKPAGSSESTGTVDARTRGDSMLGNGRLCASSALSVSPGVLVSSEKALELGRDCR